MRNVMKTLAVAVLGLGLLAGRSLAEPAGDPKAGGEVFEDRCAMCHVPKGGGQGPSLTGVVGRKAGSLAGFGYTPAMKAAGLTWTPTNLDKFLTGPTKLVPGTAMRVMIADPTERRDLISYLAQHGK